MLRLPFLLVALTLLTACGGGGHGGASALPTSAPIGHSAHSATFKITIPKAGVTPGAKRPATIPANTATIVLSVKSVNGVAPNPVPPSLTVSITDPTYCTSGATATTCTIPFTVPIAASVVVQIETLDSTGNELGLGYLGPIDTTQPTITAPPVALGGYPVSAQFTTTAISVANTGSSTPVSVNAVLKVYDGEGNLLIAPDTYGSAITIGINNDTTHALNLTTTQLTAPDTTAGASNTIPISYTSSNVLAPNVSLTATFNGTTLAMLPVVALTATPGSLPNMTVGGSAQTLSVNEPLNAQKFTLGGGVGAATESCSPANCTPSIAGGTVTITLTPSTAGTQTVTIADALGTSVSIPVTVTGASGGGGLVAPSYPVYEYGNPSGFNQGATNYGIAAGPDGNSVWFVDKYDQALGEVINPSQCNGSSCTITEGYMSISTAPNPQAIAIGSDGSIYVNDNGNFDVPTFGALIKQQCYGNPLTCSGTQTAPSSPMESAPVDVKTAPDGNVYMTDGYSNPGASPAPSAIVYTPVIGCCSSTNFQYFDVAPAPSSPNILAIDRSGQNMFFTDTGNGTIGHFALNCSPSCTAYESTFTGMSAPLQGIVEASDGYLYVAEPNEHQIDRIAATVALSCSSNCAMQTISLPSGSNASPQNLAIGPDGNVWFTDASGYVGFISLYQCANATCKAVEYATPSGGSPWGITAGPDGNVWFTESVPTGGGTPTGHIGEVQLQWLAPLSR